VAWGKIVGSSDSDQDIAKALGTVGMMIIFINRNWAVTWWQWLFYMYTKFEIGY
jgi:hypothetical protein